MSQSNEEAMRWALGLLDQMPKTDRETLEQNMTAALIVFWGALWGTFGTEYAKGFIEAQLHGMEGHADKFVKNTH